jgi:hypothetical protein
MEPYPVTLSVDYPDRDLSRLTTFFRPILAIPMWIIASMVGPITAPASALMILFRQKYPRWWFDFNLELVRLQIRLGTYLALMDDRYPSTDEHQGVHLEVPYPDVPRDLNRWLPLVKWLLALPHYVVLFFLFIGAFVAAIISWFAILLTGRYPRGLFGYIEGVLRWSNRVAGYAALMATDRYPPFRLSP